MADNQYAFPTEVLSLPSKGLLYPKDSPLSSGTIEVKYMTAKEEDILTSTNLIEKGLVVKLRDAVIFDAGIYESMVGKIINSANMNGHITVGQVRDMFDTSRKYAIAILEHLDQRKLTRRVDEWRVLI